MGLLLWLFPVGGSGWSWPGLLSVAGKNRHLALGALLWTHCTLSFMPVHPTLWKASSRSQCSRNLIQPQSFLGGISLQLCLPRRVSEGDAEPQCCGESGGRKGRTTFIALISVSGSRGRAETTELGSDCVLSGLNCCNMGLPWQPLPSSDFSPFKAAQALILSCGDLDLGTEQKKKKDVILIWINSMIWFI